MGAALRGVTGGRSKSGGVLPRPYGEQESAVRIGGGVRAPRPTESWGCGAGGSSGKSVKRRRWRKKRAGFEEVPRLAATTVDGNRLARRRAIADPYGCMARKCGAGEYGLPHQPAGWFAMTFFESAAGCENGRGSPPARLAYSSYFFIYIPERRGGGDRGGGGLRRPPAR